jgi:imidazolonepropionase-like amidohydrolase
VLVQGNRITRLDDGAQPTPDNIQTIDAQGKFLIPGLWDMHVHLLRKGRPEAYFPLLIANGITGIRDMGGDMPISSIHQLRREIDSGARLGPRIFAPGPLIDGPYPTLPSITRVVRNSDEANAAVTDLKQQGADFIKVYNRVPRDAYFTLAATAKTLGIPFAGHIPGSITAREASNAGQKSVEHLFNILFSCSSREDELMRMKAQALSSDDSGERIELREKYLQIILQSYDPDKARSLFKLFAKNGTWQTPTLVQRKAFADPPMQTPDNPAMRFIPKSLRWRWDPSQDGRLQGRSDVRKEIEHQFYQKDRALIAPMRAAGVKFLAGTDTPDGFAFPGFSLHDELAALVDAGLTPMEALQSATLNPAEYFGLKDSGLIKPGNRADLVLLDANPLQDIHNSRRIAGVMLNGKWFSRQNLQEMLDQAAVLAANN